MELRAYMFWQDGSTWKHKLFLWQLKVVRAFELDQDGCWAACTFYICLQKAGTASPREDWMNEPPEGRLHIPENDTDLW